MNLKKILALALVLVIAFSCTACTTFELIIPVTNLPVQNNNVPAETTAPAEVNTTAASNDPTESMLPDETVASNPEFTTAAQEATTAAPAPSGAPQGTAAIIAYYNTAANKIKTDAKSVTRNYEDYQHNEEKLVVPSLLKSVGSSLIGTFLKKNETPVTFNGTEEIKNGFPMPGETYVSKLTEADVVSAECKDNGTEYEITIVGKTEKNPTYGQGVSAGFEIIKTEDVMDAAGFVVKSFETEYYDCTVKCKVDKATGHVTWYYTSTPIVMVIATSVGIDAQVGMTFIKDFTITY